MEERIGIIGKMQGVRLSSTPKPKNAAALAPRPPVASRRAMRSVSESAASSGGDPAGESASEPAEKAGRMAAGADDPPGGEPGAAPSSRTATAFRIGG